MTPAAQTSEAGKVWEESVSGAMNLHVCGWLNVCEWLNDSTIRGGEGLGGERF